MAYTLLGIAYLLLLFCFIYQSCRVTQLTRERDAAIADRQAWEQMHEEWAIRTAMREQP